MFCNWWDHLLPYLEFEYHLFFVKASVEGDVLDKTNAGRLTSFLGSVMFRRAIMMLIILWRVAQNDCWDVLWVVQPGSLTELGMPMAHRAPTVKKELDIYELDSTTALDTCHHKFRSSLVFHPAPTSKSRVVILQWDVLWATLFMNSRASSICINPGTTEHKLKTCCVHPPFCLCCFHRM